MATINEIISAAVNVAPAPGNECVRILNPPVRLLVKGTNHVVYVGAVRAEVRLTNQEHGKDEWCNPELLILPPNHGLDD